MLAIEVELDHILFLDDKVAEVVFAQICSQFLGRGDPDLRRLVWLGADPLRTGQDRGRKERVMLHRRRRCRGGLRFMVARFYAYHEVGSIQSWRLLLLHFCCGSILELDLS